MASGEQQPLEEERGEAEPEEDRPERELAAAVGGGAGVALDLRVRLAAEPGGELGGIEAAGVGLARVGRDREGEAALQTLLPAGGDLHLPQPGLARDDLHLAAHVLAQAGALELGAAVLAAVGADEGS